MFEKGFLCRTMILVIVVGIAIRLAVGALLTYNYDVYSWALIISNIQAGSGLYDVTGYNYPPVWGSYLALLGQFTDLFGIDILAERVPEFIHTESDPAYSPHLAFTTTIEFNIAVTAFITVFDLMTGYVVYLLVKDVFGDERKAMICSAVWFLTPFVIVIGAVGGMFDCISGMITMLCILLLRRNQTYVAGALFAMSFFLKFMPVFLFFLFIAYLVVKDRDNCKRRILEAAVGGIAMTAIILMPHILTGHLADSFSFLTSRAQESVGYFGFIEQFWIMFSYAATFIIEIVLAYIFLRMRHEGLDRDFLVFAFFGTLFTFINPGNPQYVLFLAPLLIIMMFCVDSRYRLPYWIMFFATTWSALSAGIVDLDSIVAFTDLLDFDWYDSCYAWFRDTEILGFNMFMVEGFVGALIQYLAMLLSFLFSCKNIYIIKHDTYDDELHH